MTQAALRIWCDGPPGAPLIIVAAGFLTETPARDAPDEWATPVIDLARRHGLSAASVQWTSKNANALFASCVDTKNMVLGALSAWTDARTEADHTAQSLAGWIRQLPHPRIHLVGHS